MTAYANLAEFIDALGRVSVGILAPETNISLRCSAKNPERWGARCPCHHRSTQRARTNDPAWPKVSFGSV